MDHGKEETSNKPPLSAQYRNAAVATDAGPCSGIGKDILYKGGSVVDAAIASMLCVGLYNSQSCGIGGGFFMTVYDSKTGKATFINSRDVAPKLATKDMFAADPKLCVLGTLAVGVPGELAGYWEAHQRFGKLPWKDLFEPAIKLAKNGYIVSPFHAATLKMAAEQIHDRNFNLWPAYENEDGSLKTVGQTIKRPLLSATLRKIADEGMKAFYDGSLTSDILQDLEDGFGNCIITREDLLEYKPEIKDAMPVILDDMTMFVPGPPAGGPVLALVLKILNGASLANLIKHSSIAAPVFGSNAEGYDLKPADLTGDKKILTYHRIVEAFRFAFAKRSLLGDDRLNETITEIAQNMTSDWYANSFRSKIKDSHTSPIDYYEPEFAIQEEHGTAHLNIIGPDGSAVSMTSSVSFVLGSKILGKRTGIIFNAIMHDFSTASTKNKFGIPPSPVNLIIPGNRPVSSMCPTIIVKKDPETKKNKVKMVVGASGGARMTTSTALAILKALYFGYNTSDVVETFRIHDQLLPNVTEIEKGFDTTDIMLGLQKLGHETEERVYGVEEIAIVQAIVVRADGLLDAACDSRKAGYPSGY